MNMNNLQRQRLRLIFIFIIIVYYFSSIISVNKGEESIFTVWKNVTFEHTIYEQVKSGDNFDEILHTIIDSNVEIKLKDNVLTVKNIAFNVSDKSNIKIVNKNIEDAFSAIDDKITDKNMIIKSETASFSDYNILKYENQNYFFKNKYILTFNITCILSIIYLTLSIISIKRKLFCNFFECFDKYFIFVITLFLIILGIIFRL